MSKPQTGELTGMTMRIFPFPGCCAFRVVYLAGLTLAGVRQTIADAGTSRNLVVTLTTRRHKDVHDLVQELGFHKVDRVYSPNTGNTVIMYIRSNEKER